MKFESQYENEIADWISKKINGHGGGYSVNTIGLFHIDFICGKNSFQIAIYNIILFFKFLINITKRGKD